MNKSLLTNLCAAALVVLGYTLPVYQDQFLSTGLFALSGALTNWLAIYMLFERVPFLYGSGVIPTRFEDFKRGIHGLIMGQFFTEENVNRLLTQTGASDEPMDTSAIQAAIDYDNIFERLTQAVMGSSFGGMLNMFGGASALTGMKEPMVKVLREVVDEVLKSDKFKSAVKASLASPELAHSIVPKVDKIVKARLDELTPDDVKRIIQDMIREHLGWLVVWGGVFGGLIGLVASYVV